MRNQPGVEHEKAWPQLRSTLFLRKHFQRDNSSWKEDSLRNYKEIEKGDIFSAERKFSILIQKNIWNTCYNVLAGLYLSEVNPDIESSRPLQVGDTHTLQLPLQETVSSLQPASVFRQKLFVDPLWDTGVKWQQIFGIKLMMLVNLMYNVCFFQCQRRIKMEYFKQEKKKEAGITCKGLSIVYHK